MAQINQLTPEQEAMLPQIREEWLKIGLSTEPCNREEGNEAIKLAYQKGELAEPKTILWFDSPRTGCFAAAICQALEADNEINYLNNPPDHLEDIDKKVSLEMYQELLPFKGQLGLKKRNKVQDKTFWHSVISDMSNQVYRCGYGSQDASWLAFYDAFGRFGLDVSIIDGLVKVAKNCGWWWPFDNVCIVTSRPTQIHQDDRFRLHSEDGPALQYPDGWAIWAIHGIRVDQKVIEAPDTLTVEEIRSHPNVEIRRIMVERFGQERYLRESNAKMIHKDDFGTLWQVDMVNDEPITMVEVLNATPEPDGTYKNYFLRVPPTMKRAKEAVAWTGSMTEDEYNPTVQS